MVPFAKADNGSDVQKSMLVEPLQMRRGEGGVYFPVSETEWLRTVLT